MILKLCTFVQGCQESQGSPPPSPAADEKIDTSPSASEMHCQTAGGRREKNEIDKLGSNYSCSLPLSLSLSLSLKL